MGFDLERVSAGVQNGEPTAGVFDTNTALASGFGGFHQIAVGRNTVGNPERNGIGCQGQTDMDVTLLQFVLDPVLERIFDKDNE